MRYQKGDYIDSYKVLLLLKSGSRTETYRVRGEDGLLYALKVGVNDIEKAVAPSLETYIETGNDYVVYRYISGEGLDSKLKRELKCSAADLKRYTINLLRQLSKIHKRGYTHAAISVENIMIDLACGQSDAWLIGLSSATKSDQTPISTDLHAIGSVMHYMAFGEPPANRIRAYNGGSNSVDSHLQNIINKALALEFASAEEMIDAIEGRIEVKPTSRVLGDGFAAVAGMEDIKIRLQEDVIDILADREGAKQYGIDIPNGMLLYGPPGCGKTFIAEKFAEQAGYNYIYIKASDLASIYIHGSQEKIGALFDNARKHAPTILCFDEFDALVPRRDNINNSSHSGEVNEFLSQLNNCGKDGVFVIASTNRPDMIDPAILRTGRIDYMVYVPLPDVKARAEIFRLALKNKPSEDNIDCKYLADNTEGYLASDLTAIVNEAARAAFRQKVKISMSMLKSALSSRKPSLTKDDVAQYDNIRQKFESQKQEEERRKIGF